VSKSGVPIIAIVALAFVFAAGLFLVGFDQGHIFSIAYGEQAFEDLYIHELTHDMRHAAGFPCH
jgi:high-affinity nickel permease